MFRMWLSPMDGLCCCVVWCCVCVCCVMCVLWCCDVFGLYVMCMLCLWLYVCRCVMCVVCCVCVDVCVCVLFCGVAVVCDCVVLIVCCVQFMSLHVRCDLFSWGKEWSDQIAELELYYAPHEQCILLELPTSRCDISVTNNFSAQSQPFSSISVARRSSITLSFCLELRSGKGMTTNMFNHLRNVQTALLGIVF